MKTSYSTLMQSKYFSAAFNSAIFDGPVRIYFAQFHEQMALKIYFMIQQKLSKEFSHAKDISRAVGGNVMLMLYPTADAFQAIFTADTSKPYSVEVWNQDLVIGLNGPISEEHLNDFVNDLGAMMMSWRPVEMPKPFTVVEL